MPDVVELARKLIDSLDEVAMVNLPGPTFLALAALNEEVTRIERLRATPPEPGSLNAQLIEQLERRKGRGV